MNRYYPVIIALLFISFTAQAQKKETPKAEKAAVKGAGKTEQPAPPAPAEQKSNRLSDSTIFKIQEQLHSKNLKIKGMDLSLMTEPHRPIL